MTGERGLRVEPNIAHDSGDVASTPETAINPDPGTDTLAVVPTTLAVYRNVRIGLGLTAVMLTASILIQSIHVHAHVPAQRICFQGQLSEYFYTTAHSVFIGSLLILAALFFVYRSTTDTENALLQIAGVAALTAALVPEDKQYLREKCNPIYIRRRRCIDRHQNQFGGSCRGPRSGVVNHSASAQVQEEGCSRQRDPPEEKLGWE